MKILQRLKSKTARILGLRATKETQAEFVELLRQMGLQGVSFSVTETALEHRTFSSLSEGEARALVARGHQVLLKHQRRLVFLTHAAGKAVCVRRDAGAPAA